ncbi:MULTISPECIES: DUF397 domain-containing protein [Thermomonosporaceae]|uniref:DUF397 domain-containing protein n=1 Tax=Thermomonosporaceae TaxID=2012 RepID=UPI00255B1BDE|nr:MULTISPECIES: DUF397 domain-containing protein [Thermomonosporaceae]MDL4776234.1 DUF397 domain-containing protein [Actinomadura xylanilytica]
MSSIVTSVPTWRRSAYCGASNTCVEVATLAVAEPSIGARDAKHGTQSPVLTFSRTEWRSFVERTKKGVYDLEV